MVELTTEEPTDAIKLHVDNEKGHQQDQHIDTLTYLLIKHGVSMEFYHEISMQFKDLPRSYKVNSKIIMITISLLILYITVERV